MSLLRTEGVLPGEEVEEEENIHHNFALVERWREVSKVIRGIPVSTSVIVSQMLIKYVSCMFHISNSTSRSNDYDSCFSI